MALVIMMVDILLPSVALIPLEQTCSSRFDGEHTGTEQEEEEERFP